MRANAWLGHGGWRRWLVGAAWLLAMAPFLALGQEAAPSKAATFSPDDYAFIRGWAAAKSHPKWSRAKTLAAQLECWRNMTTEFADRGKPISERFVVTAYMGTLDLRHFLYATVKMLTPYDKNYWKGPDDFKSAWNSTGDMNTVKALEGEESFHMQMVLWDGFSVEKGPAYYKLNQDRQPNQPVVLPSGVDATPNDLPSEALGALWGQQLLAHRKDADFDVVASLVAFLAPFKPLPDKLREQFGYEELTYGDAKGATQVLKEERVTWFTAVPLVQTQLINERAGTLGLGQFCENVPNGEAALAKVGLKVMKVADQYPLRLAYINPPAN